MGGYGSLVAFPHNGEFELCEFRTSNFQPEFKTDDIWYVSMGSADHRRPCLGFIRQAFWNDGVPSVKMECSRLCGRSRKQSNSTPVASTRHYGLAY